jgi:hypothetical protein
MMPHQIDRRLLLKTATLAMSAVSPARGNASDDNAPRNAKTRPLDL